MSIILFLAGISALIIGIKKDKTIYSILFIFSISVLLYYNTFNPDYIDYKYSYNNIETTLDWFEFGFTTLIFLFNYLSISYNLFIAIIYFILLSCISWICNKNDVNSSTLLLFYLIYPLFIDMVQIRHFIASMLFFVSMIFLSKNNTVLSLLIFALATTMHSITWFMLPIYFMKFDKKLLITTISLFISFSYIVLLLLTPFNSEVFPLLLTRLGLMRYIPYFNTKMDLGILLFLTVALISFAYSNFVGKTLSTISLKSNNTYGYRLGNTISKLSVLVLFYTPLLLINSNFLRIIRFSILFYVFGTLYYFYRYRNKQSKLLMLYTVVYIGFLFIMFLGSNFNYIILPFFRDTGL